MYNYGTTQFDGPYGRYQRAVYEMQNPDAVRSTDPWVGKLRDMLSQREAFKDAEDRYRSLWPTHALMFDVYESTRNGSMREVIEALLLTEEARLDPLSLVPVLRDARFTIHFLSAYREMFYNIFPYTETNIGIAQYVIAPLLRTTGYKVAMGPIWKILACGGGLTTLVKKGFGTDPFTPEDMDFLMHLSCLRNCTTLLQYASEGSAFTEENPAAASLITTFVELEATRNTKREATGLKKEERVTRSQLENILGGLVRLKKDVREPTEELMLKDGTFNPEDSEFTIAPRCIEFETDNEEDDDE